MVNIILIPGRVLERNPSPRISFQRSLYRPTPVHHRWKGSLCSNEVSKDVERYGPPWTIHGAKGWMNGSTRVERSESREEEEINHKQKEIGSDKKDVLVRLWPQRSSNREINKRLSWPIWGIGVSVEIGQTIERKDMCSIKWGNLLDGHPMLIRFFCVGDVKGPTYKEPHQEIRYGTTSEDGRPQDCMGDQRRNLQLLFVWTMNHRIIFRSSASLCQKPFK